LFGRDVYRGSAEAHQERAERLLQRAQSAEESLERTRQQTVDAALRVGQSQATVDFLGRGGAPDPTDLENVRTQLIALKRDLGMPSDGTAAK